jgi:branched-chain amino acid transport system permease protein
MAMYAGIVFGIVVVTFLGGAVFSTVPKLHTTVEGSKLRLVLLAVTLIVLMLIRPQGVFAHHEFSLSWLERLMGKKAPTKEIAV